MSTEDLTILIEEKRNQVAELYRIACDASAELDMLIVEAMKRGIIDESPYLITTATLALSQP